MELSFIIPIYNTEVSLLSRCSNNENSFNSLIGKIY